MNKKSAFQKTIAAAFILLATFCCAPRTFATDYIWDGGGVDNNFSTVANWNPNTAPPLSSVVTVLRFAGSTRLAPNAQAPYSVGGIQFDSGAGAFVVGGGQLTLEGTFQVTQNSASPETINNNLALNAIGVWGTGSGAGALTIGGTVALGNNTLLAAPITGTSMAFTNAVSGNGSFTLSGPDNFTRAGTVTFSGAGANTFTGMTTVNDGTLILSKAGGVAAIGGALVVGGSNVAGAVPKVQLVGNSQLTSTTDVTVSSDGTLDVNSTSTSIRALSMSGGVVSIGTGTLILNGNVSAFAGPAAAAQITSTDFVNDLNLGGATRTFQVGASGTASYDLDIQAGISSGTLLKTGNGILRLAGTTNAGFAVILNQGTLAIGSDTALGAGTFTVAGGTFQADGATRTLANAVSFTGSTAIGSFQNLNMAGAATIATNSFALTMNMSGPSYTTTFSGGFKDDGVGRSLTINGTNSSVVTGKVVLNGINTFASFFSMGTNAFVSETAGSLAPSSMSIDTGATFNLVAGTLTAGSQSVGGTGAGTFNQNGGGNTVSSGSLSVNALGTYSLAGGTLQAPFESVSGTFTHSAGTNNVTNTLSVFGNSNGAVNYSLSSTGGVTAVTENIGGSSSAIFAQSGGTNQVSGVLSIGLGIGPVATYNLSGGTLTTPNSAGGFSTDRYSVFHQTGGTENGYLRNNGTFTFNAGTFNGTLENTITGTTNVNGGLTVASGVLNNGTINANFNGTLSAAGGKAIDNESTLVLNAGALGGAGAIINNATLSGFGTIGGSGGFTNNSLVAQGAGNLVINNAGTNTNTGTMNLAAYAFQLDSNLINSGAISLAGTTVKGTAMITNASGGIIEGYGTFLNAFTNPAGATIAPGSGVLRFNNGLSNAGYIAMSLSGPLSGGTITNTGLITDAGTINNLVNNNAGGSIEPSGGTLTFNGGLTNGAGSTISAASGGKILVSAGLATNSGTINLSGGVFDNNSHALNNAGSITGFGAIRVGTGVNGLTNAGSVLLAGGSATITGDVINANGATIKVSYTPALFNGNFTNNAGATFKTTGTSVTFAGTFTNNGLFTSDPAKQYFSSLVIGQTGALQGGEGDQFIVSNDITNQSNQTTSFDISAAALILQGSGSHQVAWRSADLGAVAAGYLNNFAIGTLELAAGNSLLLADGNNISGAALYVHSLVLGGGLAQIASIVGNGASIYYDAADPANAYLNDGTYGLQGGGELAPVNAVPEPSTTMLLGLAVLAGVSLYRRKVCRS